MKTLADRVNTEPLRRVGVPTVALMVLNENVSDVPPCRVRFRAAFPVRETMPVTVRDDRGNVVPSRISEETVTPDAPGFILWSLTLEFGLPDGIAARSGRTFAASYELGATVANFDGLPLRDDLPVCETGLHTGELPTTFALPV